MLAQGPVEFPWNPDADGDDFIGVNDLMALLGEFDSVFSEEELYVTEDGQAAIFHATGGKNYLQCYSVCSQLPGNWKIPSLNEFGSVWSNLSPPDFSYYWIHSQGALTGESGNNDEYGWRVLRYPNNYQDGAIGGSNFRSVHSCACFTKERPKVEYSYCEGQNITECATVKVQDGWYPLGGISSYYDQAAGNQIRTQAFWRWAE